MSQPIQRDVGVESVLYGTSPDIIGIHHDGKVDMVEVPHPGDDVEALTIRMDALQNMLPDDGAGEQYAVHMKEMGHDG